MVILSIPVSPTMTIYGGMTSNGIPLVVEEPLSVIDARHTTANGLFIRLQGKVDFINIKLAYLAYTRPVLGRYPDSGSVKGQFFTGTQ